MFMRSGTLFLSGNGCRIFLRLSCLSANGQNYLMEHMEIYFCAASAARAKCMRRSCNGTSERSAWSTGKCLFLIGNLLHVIMCAQYDRYGTGPLEHCELYWVTCISNLEVCLGKL